MKTRIERKLIVNEISLKKFLTYTNSVYDIGEKFKHLERKKTENLRRGLNTQTKAYTGAKMVLLNCLCFNRSVNELITTIHSKDTSLLNFFDKREYVPKTHGFRECIINTPSQQLSCINDSVILKAKENKVFKKNEVDGLCVVAWDGVEATETNKNIEQLPEREHSNNDIRKYIKYLCAMNVGEKCNLFIAEKQMTEIEKVITETGKKKAKTFGETTAFIDMLPEVERTLGRIIDVNVFDALFLNSNVMNTISKSNQYFVIRMEDDTKNIYKDAKGIFDKSKPSKEYEIVEVTEEINVKYSKKAKHKDFRKVKTHKKTRKITNNEINKRILVNTKYQKAKNSEKEIKIYEKVIRKIRVWDDEFNFVTYKGQVRVVRTNELLFKNGKEVKQEVYIATNMLSHNVETIIKIMHLRWNIENNGFRKLKQEFKFNHIFIGEFNSINYIFQMMILVYNLLELYLKFRLKIEIKKTYIQLKKTFEKEINITERIWEYFMKFT